MLANLDLSYHYMKKYGIDALVSTKPISIKYFAEFESEKHGRVLFGKNGPLGKAIVHAFYKKHNFPYNAKLAGKVNLGDYQPSAEEIREKIGTKVSTVRSKACKA